MSDTIKTRIMIVDDHPVVREGLLRLLNEEPGLEICCTADNANETIDQLERDKPDLIIVDISLKGIDGIELTKSILSREPGILVLVLSMHDEKIYAERALKAGARGYVMKQEGTDKLIEAVEKIKQGGIYLSERMNTILLEKVVSGNQTVIADPINRLTDRELNVFELIGRGLKNKQIADKLYLSVKTVESHRENIKSKLNIDSSMELIKLASMWISENGVQSE